MQRRARKVTDMPTPIRNGRLSVHIETNEDQSENTSAPRLIPKAGSFLEEAEKMDIASKVRYFISPELHVPGTIYFPSRKMMPYIPQEDMPKVQEDTNKDVEVMLKL